MARIEVTKELAETLRELRIQYKVQAKDVAEALGKSNAYITKLEKGGIQTISKEELETILDIITNNAENPESVEERIVKLLRIKYTEEEINEQIWFYNFDTLFRRIPIPEGLSNEINDMLEQYEISRSYLFDRINSNEGLPIESQNDETIPYNEWFKTGSTIGIKLKLEWNTFNDFLDKKTEKIIYMYPYSILTYLFLIISEYKQDNEKSFSHCQNLAIQTLNKHKFFSLREKSMLSNVNQTEREKDEILTSFDKENIDIINKILSGFRFITEADIKIANERLSAFANNLEFNIGFMSKLISLDYKKLDSVSIEKKRSFLKDVDKLINEYSNETEDQDDISLY